MKSAQAKKWESEPLSELIRHIVEKHHGYCRQELVRLGPLLNEVVDEYGERNPELRQIRVLFMDLDRELSLHLAKEEQTLFPYIVRLEEAVNRRVAMPRPSYGTVANPVKFMMLEHATNDAWLKEIRRLSNGYFVPAYGGHRYRALYEGLRRFEEDMLDHTDLEEDVVFPRAIDLEERSSGAGPDLINLKGH